MTRIGVVWLASLARRRWAATVSAVLAVAITVALLASIFGFLGSAEATMTSRAVANVAVDWQVQLAPGADPAQALSELQRSPGAAKAIQVGYFHAPGFQTTDGGSTQTTGPGYVLGLGEGYLAAFPQEIRNLVGSGDVLLFQQTAANLHAAPGSIVSIQRPGLDPARVTIGAVVDLPLADSLFQVVGAAPGTAPQAPPDNVLILPLAQWHSLFDPAAAAAPDALRLQIHAAIPHDLPNSPAAAYTQVTGMARNYETRLAGAGVVGDNLAARLDAARADAAYARVLFLFLGAPGVALAAMLTVVVFAAAAERRRRDRSLLKLRGASAAQILRLALLEAIFLGVCGGAIGLAAAGLVVRASFGSWSFGTSRAASLQWTLAALLAGIALSVAALVVPAWRDIRFERVVGGRIAVRRGRGPIWERIGLDIVFLGIAALAYWRASQNGYQLVLATEGAPRVAVSYTPFIAPLFLWVGAVLFTLRVIRMLLVRARSATAIAVKPFAGRLSTLVSAALSRQTSSLLPGVGMVMLAIAFAISTATFNSTYAAQARVDAELTNGADVTVTGGPGATLASTAAVIRALPGVASIASMQHRFAYVGNDLQDIFGVNAATIGATAKLSNAFFSGGTAAELMAKLAATPDGVLVSQETVTDYQLQPGDAIKLRLMSSADHQYHAVLFHYVGIAREFPTAPKDSFLVANASYLAAKTASDTAETLLIKTTGSPTTLANQVRGLLGPASGATVQDIQSVERSIASELTAVSLRGLTRIELAFALALAGAGAALVFAAGFDQRRRTLAISTALGATARQARGIVWSEVAIILTGGLFGGFALGFVASRMLVKILTQVFDPPPAFMTIPWAYIGLSVGIAAAAVIAAGRLSAKRGELGVLETLRRF